VRSVHLHTTLDEPLAREWDELADRTAVPPFLRPGWVSAWAAAFARSPLRVAALRRDDRLVAVLPLLLRRSVVRSPTNWHTPVFGPVVQDADAAARLGGWLMGLGARRISMDFVDATSAATRELEAAARMASYRSTSRVRLRSPYLELTGMRDGAEQVLTAKRRSNLRRQCRRLGRIGALTLEVHDGRQDLDRRLAEAFAVEGSGWKAERGSAIASRAETLRFYRDVAAWAAGRGWLRILILRCGDRAIACDIGIDDGSHYLVKTGYDPEFRNYAPGVVLRRDAIARAAEAGLTTYEFLGHVAPTKLEWTDSFRERILLQAFRPTPLGALDRAVRVHARAIAVEVHQAATRQ
jgi:CelD/BcsL family acetyltransferase involved in cellulose biosynthesis